MNISNFQKEFISFLEPLEDRQSINDTIIKLIEDEICASNEYLTYSPSPIPNITYYYQSKLDTATINRYEDNFLKSQELVSKYDRTKREDVKISDWTTLDSIGIKMSDFYLLDLIKTNPLLLQEEQIHKDNLQKLFIKVIEILELIELLIKEEIIAKMPRRGGVLNIGNKHLFDGEKNYRHIFPSQMEGEPLQSFTSLVSPYYEIRNKNLLLDFIRKNYKTQAQYNHEEAISNANKSARNSYFAAIAATLTAIITLSGTIVNCNISNQPSLVKVITPVEVEQVLPIYSQNNRKGENMNVTTTNLFEPYIPKSQQKIEAQFLDFQDFIEPPNLKTTFKINQK